LIGSMAVVYDTGASGGLRHSFRPCSNRLVFDPEKPDR
jgi:hypothetical protein